MTLPSPPIRQQAPAGPQSAKLAAVAAEMSVLRALPTDLQRYLALRTLQRWGGLRGRGSGNCLADQSLACAAAAVRGPDARRRLRRAD